MIDLLALSKTWKAGQTINLPPGEYQTAGQIFLIGLDGLTLNFPTRTILHAPPTKSVFEVRSKNVAINGVSVPVGGVVFHVQGDGFRASNFQVGIGSPDGSVQQAILCENGGTSATFSNFSIGVTASESAYLYTNGCRLLGPFSFAGSQGEYRIRVSAQGEDSSKRPTGIVISGGTFPKHENGPGKPVMDFRDGDGSILACEIHGWIGFGETSFTVPGSACNINLVGNLFRDCPPGHAYAELRGGSKVIESANTFDQPNGAGAIAVGSGAALVTSGSSTAFIPQPTAAVPIVHPGGAVMPPGSAGPQSAAATAAPTSPPLPNPVQLHGSGVTAGKGIKLAWLVPALLAGLALMALALAERA